MFGKSKQPEATVVFVRDADVATAALRRPLAEARSAAAKGAWATGSLVRVGGEPSAGASGGSS